MTRKNKNASHNAKVMHYTDDMGLEADAVYREPSVLMVICANAPMAYTADNGVKIVPIGCLKD